MHHAARFSDFVYKHFDFLVFVRCVLRSTNDCLTLRSVYSASAFRENERISSS